MFQVAMSPLEKETEIDYDRMQHNVKTVKDRYEREFDLLLNK